MRQTFLYKVKQHSRKLYWAMLLFAGGSLLCNIIGYEVTPFFVWGMYSKKEEPVKKYEFLRTTVNDSLVVRSDDYPAETALFINDPLGYYKEIRDNKGIDPTFSFLHRKLPAFTPPLQLFNDDARQSQFLPWYGAYLTRLTGVTVRSLKVEVIQAHYEGSKLVVDAVYLFEKWPRS